MSQVKSKDGTTIAYERSGSGPALILVDGALCSRAFGPSPKLAPLLAPHFTVYAYDRRGRGQSGDTPPYAPAREVEDIAALIDAAGGSASLLGSVVGRRARARSRGQRAARQQGRRLRAAVRGRQRPARRSRARGAARTLLAEGNRGGAVRYFMKDMVGVPAPCVVMMRLMPWIWRKLEAVAHTLPYDAAVMTRVQGSARALRVDRGAGRS